MPSPQDRVDRNQRKPIHSVVLERANINVLKGYDMTLLYKEHPETKTVEIHVEGKVSREEFDAVIADMDAFIQTHGTVKLLESVASFKVGMDVSMFWEGLKFDMKISATSAIALWCRILAGSAHCQRRPGRLCRPNCAPSIWMKSARRGRG